MYVSVVCTLRIDHYLFWRCPSVCMSKLLVPPLRFAPHALHLRTILGTVQYDDDINYVSLTVWEGKDAFTAWRKGEAFKEAHGGNDFFSFVKMVTSSLLTIKGAPKPGPSSPPRSLPLSLSLSLCVSLSRLLALSHSLTCWSSAPPPPPPGPSFSPTVQLSLSLSCHLSLSVALFVPF